MGMTSSAQLQDGSHQVTLISDAKETNGLLVPKKPFTPYILGTIDNRYVDGVQSSCQNGVETQNHVSHGGSRSFHNFELLWDSTCWNVNIFFRRGGLVILN